MRLTLTTVAVVSVSAVACASAAVSSGEQTAPTSPSSNAGRMLIDVIETPRARPRRVQETGVIPEGDDVYDLTADRPSGTDLSILLRVNGQQIGSVQLTDADYPNLDLSSLESFTQRTRSGVVFIVSVKYGGESDCFVDDDGRNRIRIHFVEHDAVIVNDMSFVNCEPRVQEVDLGAN